MASSNVSLDSEVKAGRFRLDLFHRLNEFTMHVPPLRERAQDILHLARRFLDEANLELKKSVQGFSEEAVAYLLSYPWPGNVRELRNVVRRATLQRRDRIGPEHLSGLDAKGTALPYVAFEGVQLENGLSLKEISSMATARVEREVIQRVLRLTKGNKSQAARLLKIDYKTLYAEIKGYGIQSKEFLP
jgi:two-component system nitrogen regulation response regulator GlnG